MSPNTYDLSSQMRCSHTWKQSKWMSNTDMVPCFYVVRCVSVFWYLYYQSSLRQRLGGRECLTQPAYILHLCIVQITNNEGDRQWPFRTDTLLIV